MPKSNSVLLIGNFLSGHVGNYSVCEDLARQLESAGLNVLTTSHHKPRVKRLLDFISTIWRRRREYGVAHVDVYSGRAFRMAEAACFALRSVNKPYVLTLRGGNLPPFAQRQPQRVSRLLQSAVTVTSPSDFLLEQMKPYHSDIRLLPNPLDINRYPFRLRETAKPRLVWLRSFYKSYNPTMAAKVVAELQSDYPDITLTMIGHDKGDGSLQATQQTARELGVSGRIKFPGGVAKKEVPKWLDRGDIFLNTTNVDNTPVSVLEAMACGLCVVSTDAGGMPYLVENERDAMLVRAEDREAMVSAIRRVMTEPTLAARLSQNARNSVQQCDWRVVLPQWQQLFEQASGTSNKLQLVS